MALDAYGWSGPWANRRGFDSLVQMSCGIAHAGMVHFGAGPAGSGGLPEGGDGAGRPTPLPVQALDHATGYLCAAAVVEAWTGRLGGSVRNARLSLARTAVELMRSGPSDPGAPLPSASPGQLVPEATGWGPGVRLPPAMQLAGLAESTDVRARGYGSAPAAWAAWAAWA